MILNTPFANVYYMLVGKDKTMQTATISREQAYQEMKALTGQDFGYDSLKWLEYGIHERFGELLKQSHHEKFNQK